MLSDWLKMKVLIVEDSIDRFQVLASQFPDAILTFARTAPQAIFELKYNQFDVIMLDHDLDDGNTGCNGEGIDVAKFLSINLKLPKPRIIIHSANHYGAENMASVLRNANYEVEIFSFLKMEFNQRCLKN